MLDHFCVLSVLLTVIFGAILHFFIQGMAILHSWDGYFTFWERNHPGHYTQELGTDCISTAISLIISSLHQWEASVFFLFCALYEQEVSEINIKMVSQSRTPLTPSPSTTSIISEALGVSRKSDSWEVWGVEDNTGFSDQKVQQVKTQKVLFISDERVSSQR